MTSYSELTSSKVRSGSKSAFINYDGYPYLLIISGARSEYRQTLKDIPQNKSKKKIDRKSQA
jgi:hypothetical protein